MNKRRLMLVGLVIGLVLTACGGQTTEQPSTLTDELPQSPVRGKIVDLEEVEQDDSDLPLVVSFTLSTGDQELIFKVGESVDRDSWNTFHFQGHLRFGELVGVAFEETVEGLIAVMLTE